MNTKTEIKELKELRDKLNFCYTNIIFKMPEHFKQDTTILKVDLNFYIKELEELIK